MHSIEPRTLRKLRKMKRLTLDQLAEKSGLDKQSIHRLEQGRRSRARETTIAKLASALDVEAARLTTPLADGQEAEAVSVVESNKSQLNLRVSGQARNALLLASERYHVKPAQIVELAPFLFFWVAEKCLRQREERLNSLRQRSAEISEKVEHIVAELNELIDGPPLEVSDLGKWDYLDEGFDYEEIAIQHRFLFGEFGGSPIADFLAQLASELGEQSDFYGWDWDSSPMYSICREEAERLANGDEIAVENILQGYAPLQELPKEDWEQLRHHGATILADPDQIENIKSKRQRRMEERVEWLREHGKPRSDDSSETAS